MDPICEQKYNFLQKYVPFLANLIKQLASDMEKHSKMVQMQLLYDLLNKPDNSVNIETLEKCEEVLCRVFGNNDENIMAEDEWVMPLPFIKSELPEEVEDSSEKVQETNWENLNGSSENKIEDMSTSVNNCNPTKENETESSHTNDKTDQESSSTLTTDPQPITNESHNSQETITTPCEVEEDKKDLSNDLPIEKEPETKSETDKTHDDHCPTEANEKEIENKTSDDKQHDEQSITSDTKNKTEIEKETNDTADSVKQNDDKLEKSDIEEKKTEEKEPTIVSSISNESDEVVETINNKDNVENKQEIECPKNIDEPLPNSEEEETLPMVDIEQIPEAPDKAETKSPDPSVSCDKTSETVTDKTVSDESIQTKTETPSTLCEVVEKEPKDEMNEVAEDIPASTDNPEESKKTTPDKKDDVNLESATDLEGFKMVSVESLDSDKEKTAIETNESATADTPTITDACSSPTQSNDTAKETLISSTNQDCPPEQDPLNNEKESNTLENGATETSKTPSKDQADDDDDDDVLLIENRSSPICIDSDPEDEENAKLNRTLPIVPTKQPTPQFRQQLRRSTSAVAEKIKQIINNNQNITIKRKVPIMPKQNKTTSKSAAFVKKDPKALMETIDLLDSDSDDEQNKSNNKKIQMKKNSNIDDDVIIVSSTQPDRKSLVKKSNQSISTSKLIPRFPTKPINKSPVKPATAQSNFLNAVNLQPAKSNSSNPATFSARLSNKKVIIPNAFYGNPSYNRKQSPSSFPSSVPAKTSGVNNNESSTVVVSDSAALAPPTRAVGVHSGVSIRHVQDKVLKEWLDGFLTNFASPLQIASHACFVLLQRVLKYRFFQRLKETRIFLNQAAKTCSAESVDVQMLLDLRNVFLENDYLTEAGRRFCRFATNDAFGKPVALTTDTRTGRVTCRTRVASKSDISSSISKVPTPITLDKQSTSSTTTIHSPVPGTPPAQLLSKSLNSQPSSASSSTSSPSVPKRRGKFRKLSDGLVVAEKDEDDNDYTPSHDEFGAGAQVVTERKMSLRTSRTKRKEAGFTYSEDHDDEEFEALARKIENKKREELRLAEERETELENMRLELQPRSNNKKTSAKKSTAKRNGGVPDNTKGPTRKKLRLANASIVGSEENDLLTPTWIEADADDGELDSLLDFADDPNSPEKDTILIQENENLDEDTFVNDETTMDDMMPQDATESMLKNIDRNLHLHNPSHDVCVHCSKRVPRIVHHYVNEHRSSEVFVSRLRNRDIRRLLTTSNLGFVHLYKGNQTQYAAHCIFCDKEAKFLLPYWFEHFTMHTGEYSFKCSGCQIMKPTRSLLTNHITSNAGCPKKGTAKRLINFDTKVHQIEAHICSICNYVQLQRKNLLRHLRTQHGLDLISPDQIIKVVLLQISAPQQDAAPQDDPQLALIQNSDDEDNPQNCGTLPLDDNSFMMQQDFTDNDDLSFMICGMLDVQTNNY